MESEHPGDFAFCEEPAGPVKGDGKSQIFKEVRRHSREIGQRLSRQIRAEARSILLGQKETVSNDLEELANALRDAGERLKARQKQSAARITETGAASVDRVTSYLRQADPDEIVGRMGAFARRRPVVFASFALATGFIIGQMVSDYGRSYPESPRVIRAKTESAIEYHPAEDEEGYYERH